MNNKLFVGFGDRRGYISVLDADTLALLYTVPGFTCVTDIASCLDCDEIYVTDCENYKIFELDEHEVKSQWPVPGHPVRAAFQSTQGEI